MKEASFSSKRLADLMKGRFTDGKLAYASGVSRSMIYYMRKGERTRVSAEILAAVARPLGTSVEYLMGETEDPQPTQKTMSTLAADIVRILDGLPPSKQRELVGIASTLDALEKEATVESIYNDLMDRITRLAEIDGGEEALERLIDYLNSVSGRSAESSGSPSSSVSRSRGGKGRTKNNTEAMDEPTQGGE